jgi:hypothetical protein
MPLACWLWVAMPFGNRRSACEIKGIDLFHFLAQHYPEIAFLNTIDYLNIHKQPTILVLIHNAGYQFVLCAPYWSCNAVQLNMFSSIPFYVSCRWNTIQLILLLPW